MTDTPPDTTRTCRHCNETKPLEEFVRNPSGRGGYQNVCKACHREGFRLRHRRNPQPSLEERTAAARLTPVYCNICGARLPKFGPGLCDAHTPGNHMECAECSWCAYCRKRVAVGIWPLCGVPDADDFDRLAARGLVEADYRPYTRDWAGGDQASHNYH